MNEAQYTSPRLHSPSLARAASRPRIADGRDSHAEVGDAALAAYERNRPDPVDAIVRMLLVNKMM